MMTVIYVTTYLMGAVLATAALAFYDERSAMKAKREARRYQRFEPGAMLGFSACWPVVLCIALMLAPFLLAVFVGESLAQSVTDKAKREE